MSGWQAWHWDTPTLLWTLWLAWFLVQETVALYTPLPVDTLTAHLRPALVGHPLTWFLALGLWLWLGWHFLVEGVFVAATGAG